MTYTALQPKPVPDLKLLVHQIVEQGTTMLASIEYLREQALTGSTTQIEAWLDLETAGTRTVALIRELERWSRKPSRA